MAKRTTPGPARFTAPVLASAVVLGGLASCAGIQSTVDRLRARHLEIIDGEDNLRMDVEQELRRLHERIAKLEAELAKVREAPPPPRPPAEPAPAPAAATSATASARPPARPARAPADLGY